MCVCVCVCVYVCMYVCVLVNACTSVCVCVCVHVCDSVQCIACLMCLVDAFYSMWICLCQSRSRHYISSLVDIT